MSNEVIRSRSYVLAENIAKWGRPDTIVINNDPEEIGEALPHLFDVIVTDERIPEQMISIIEEAGVDLIIVR